MKIRKRFQLKKLLIMSFGFLLTLFLFYILIDYLLHEKIPVPFKIVEEALKALTGALLLFFTQLYFEEKELAKYKPQLKVFFREIIDVAYQGIEMVKQIESSGLKNLKKLDSHLAEERDKLERIKNEMQQIVNSKLEEIAKTPQAFKKVPDGLIDSIYDLHKILEKSLLDGVQDFTGQLSKISTQILGIIKCEGLV